MISFPVLACARIVAWQLVLPQTFMARRSPKTESNNNALP
jgi:hypothetical protein